VLNIEQSKETREAPPILVTGMHRSGTTWLGQMLCASGALVNIQEPMKPTNRRTIFPSRARHWYLYISTENERDYLRSYSDAIAFRPHPLEDMGKVRSPRDAFRFTSRWASYAVGRLQRKRLLLKDPFAVFSVEWFARRLACDVVIIVRHPAAVVSSLTRLDYRFDFTDLIKQPLLMKEHLEPFRPALEKAVGAPHDVVGQGSLLWAMIYQFVHEYRTQDPRVLVLRHEDLSLNPLAEYAALYARVGLTLTPRAKQTIARFTSNRNPSELSRSNPVAAPLDSRTNVSNWTRRLRPDEIARIREITAGVWERYYEAEDWMPNARAHS